MKNNEVGAIIITPTRELAQQIYDIALLFTKPISLSVLLLIGGREVSEDIENYKNNGGNIVVATPGRLEDIMNRMGISFKVKELEVLVLDEADLLLDMGFHMSITSIIKRLPKQRRTGLFSATLTKQVNELLKAGLRNPVKISVKVEDKSTNTKQSVPLTLKNFYKICDADKKLNVLVNFLNLHIHDKVIVFFMTTASVDFFWKAFRDLKILKDIPIYSLHGKVPHKKRTKIYQEFLKPGKGILFTTDVAARGLDFNDINWVVQFDPPQDPNFFVHRIGRTARIGREGSSLLLLMPNEETYLQFLGNRNIHLEEINIKETAGQDYLTRIKKLAKTQREMVEKNTVAFISFIRAYKEHHCNYIFRLNTLDMGSLARSFGLIKLPKMPELNNLKIDFVEENVNIEHIPYHDRIKEKQRKQKIKNQKRKEKIQKEKQLLEEKVDDSESHESSDLEEEDDDLEDDLEMEARLLKKLKRKQITEEEYERQTGELDLEAKVLERANKKFKKSKR